ncbi:hypothetical protein AB0F43_27845 [Kribbella sp. NPDC023972]|uniref:hypothetical protein n=1 Tax=Kribbella sp. NPDC023972 TaxID=3154795 RepID=UPI0033E95F60
MGKLIEEWTRRARARRLRERAVRYTENSWPVAPLAVPQEAGSAPELVGEVVRTGAEAQVVWGENGWDIALIAQHFEVMELPPEFGALLNHQLKQSCPTAMAPARRHWLFFLEAGSVAAERIAMVGGVLHRDWVPAPGTRLESTGRIRWLVQPYQTRWQPLRRQDPIDTVLGSFSDWCQRTAITGSGSP